MLLGLQQFRHTTTAVLLSTLPFLWLFGWQLRFSSDTSADNIMFTCILVQRRRCFAVHRRTDQGKDRGGKAAYSQMDFSTERHGDIEYGVLFTVTVVGLLNTNHFRTSDKHLLRCSVLGRFLHGSVDWAHKTPFVWCPALFANDMDGPPPVFVEPISFGGSRVKLGRQRERIFETEFRCQSDVNGGAAGDMRS